MVIRARRHTAAELDPPHPGGRWHRVLDALADGPLRMSEIHRATDGGRHSRKVEQTKLRRAVLDLHRLGLVQFVSPDWGWDLTPSGRAARDRLNAGDAVAGMVRAA